MQRIRGGTHFNIIGRARLWFIISGLVILVSVTSLYFRGINAGLEFRGGTAFQAEADRSDLSVEDVRGALEGGVAHVTVQQLGDRGFLVQTEHLVPRDQAKAVGALAEELGIDTNDVDVTSVGPKWGAQISNKAVRALIIFLIFVTLYLTFRLEWKMAGAAMLALVHDLAVTTGIYSLSGFEVTPSTVIALLTILGYSLYDTVVIFDRVKDRTANLSAAGRVTYSQAANQAMNQVLLRSINTSIVSLLPVGSLLFVGSFLLGAQTLRELALALFVGLAAGAYSSVFIATPALAIWKERENRWKTLRQRIAARGEGAGAAFPPPPPPAAPPPAVEGAPQAPGIPTATAVADPADPADPTGPPKPPKKQQRRKKRKHGRR
jgi:preprotein translocase subunit SecF